LNSVIALVAVVPHETKLERRLAAARWAITRTNAHTKTIIGTFDDAAAAVAVARRFPKEVTWALEARNG
jgi:hypothetical protein